MRAFERRTHDIDVADALEGVVDAAVGHVDDGFLDRHGQLARVDEVGGAELAGQVELVFIDVDGDDARRLGHHRALDGGQTDGTEAEDGDGRARLDLGGVHHRADTGGDATAQQADLVQRRFLGHLGQRDFRHHGVFGEGRGAHVVVQHLAIEGEARGAVRHQAATLGGTHGAAQVGLAGEAELALAAFRGIERNDVVARHQASHALAHFLDDTGAFVAQYGREQAFRVCAGQGERIGVTDGGIDDAYQHLTGLRPFDIDLDQFQRLAGFQRNRST